MFSVLLKELYTKVLLASIHLVQSIGIFITLFGGNFLSQPSQNMKHRDTINLSHVVLNLVHTISPHKGILCFCPHPSLTCVKTEKWVQVENAKVLLVSTNNLG